MDKLIIADKSFSSRLFLGTGKFANYKQMQDTLICSQTQLVTAALRRLESTKESPEDKLLDYIVTIKGVNLLPNTSGARTAKEAIFAAQLSKEVFKTNWVKLEIHPNQDHLMPDPIETLKAAETLVKEGFIVLPYIHADPILCKRLEDIGVQAVMPLGSAISSNRGLESIHFLEMIISQSNVPVIIDAGIGSPSQAAKAMEIGADAVLVNTAIATASNPINMALAFKLAVKSGRKAFKAGLPEENQPTASTSPLTNFL